MSVTAIVLCGGKERRFGSNKALALVAGKRIIDRIFEQLEPISDQILLVTAPGKTEFPATEQAHIIVDKYPGKGPLGGIYTGLLAAANPTAVVVGCDMPFINGKLLKYMIELVDGYDAVIPKLKENMLESLHAVYRRSCISVIHRALEDNRLSIYQITSKLNVRYVPVSEYLKIDKRMLSFFNINYPEDLERANRIAAGEDSTDLSS